MKIEINLWFYKELGVIFLAGWWDFLWPFPPTYNTNCDIKALRGCQAASLDLLPFINLYCFIAGCSLEHVFGLEQFVFFFFNQQWPNQYFGQANTHSFRTNLLNQSLFSHISKAISSLTVVRTTLLSLLWVANVSRSAADVKQKEVEV